MRRSLLPLVALALLAVAAAGRCSRGPDRDGYIRRNLQVAAQIPVYPRAEPVGIETSACRSSDGVWSAPAGYWTTLTYRLPPRTPRRAVIAFFKRELPNWRVDDESAAPSLSLRRNDDYVHILVAPRAYYLGVDHEYPGCPGA